MRVGFGRKLAISGISVLLAVCLFIVPAENRWTRSRLSFLETKKAEAFAPIVGIGISALFAAVAYGCGVYATKETDNLVSCISDYITDPDTQTYVDFVTGATSSCDVSSVSIPAKILNGIFDFICDKFGVTAAVKNSLSSLISADEVYGETAARNAAIKEAYGIPKCTYSFEHNYDSGSFSFYNLFADGVSIGSVRTHIKDTSFRYEYYYSEKTTNSIPSCTGLTSSGAGTLQAGHLYYMLCSTGISSDSSQRSHRPLEYVEVDSIDFASLNAEFSPQLTADDMRFGNIYDQRTGAADEETFTIPNTFSSPSDLEGKTYSDVLTTPDENTLGQAYYDSSSGAIHNYGKFTDLLAQIGIEPLPEEVNVPEDVESETEIIVNDDGSISFVNYKLGIDWTYTYQDTDGSDPSSGDDDRKKKLLKIGTAVGAIGLSSLISSDTPTITAPPETTSVPTAAPTTSESPEAPEPTATSDPQELPDFTWPEYPDWHWPEMPDFNWPEMPDFKWPEMPDFNWPEMPDFRWPELPDFKWPEMPDFKWPEFPDFKWPEFPEIPDLQWPDFPDFQWPDLPEWEWPDYPPWEWPDYPEWEWPEFPDIAAPLEELLKKLFVPSVPPWQPIIDTFQEKFPWIEKLADWDQIAACSWGGSKPSFPVKSIFMDEKGKLHYINVVSGELVDFDMFEEYKDWIQAIMLAVSWFMFIRRVMKRIPAIIGGITSVTE